MTAHHRRALASATSLIALLSGLAPAAPAFAQGTNVLEEIVVTSQRREEKLTDVPIAVTVLSGDQIDASFTSSIESLQALVPTLTFRKGGTNLNSSLFLRGVGTINFSIAAEPSVSYVLDGVVMAKAGEAFGDLYDLERIEILRGPQGTLFGKNSSAGVVSVTTKKPSDQFEAAVDLSAFRGSEYRAKTSVNIPFSDTVRSRITGFYGSYDGNITNLFVPSTNAQPEKINGYDRKGVRAVVDIDASDTLKFTLIGDYREADDDCCGEIIGTTPTGAQAQALLRGLAGVRLLGDETREVNHNLVTRTIEKAWGTSLQGDLQVGDHTLTSITAFRKWDNNEVREGDWLGYGAAYVGIAQLHDFGPQESQTFSEELRLTSPGGETIDYVAGLYYFNADAKRLFRRDDIVCSASTLALDATGQRPCLAGASTFTFPSSTAVFSSKFENLAFFGNATFNVSDRLRLIGGLRWTSDDLEFRHVRFNPTNLAGPGIRNDTFNAANDVDKKNLSGRAGIQYDVSDETMAYATYSRGYKGPAFNVFFNMTDTAIPPIAAETANSFEVGSKSQLFDNRVIFNVAAFYARYKNFQANNFDTLNGVVITRLTNAGTISTKGVEVDFLAQPADDFTLSGGIALTDAQIQEFRVPPGAPASATTRKGEGLPLSPDWKASLAAQYVVPMNAFNMYLNSDISYSSSQVSDLQADPVVRRQLTIDSYASWNASIGFSDKDEKYRLSFIVKNITDQSFASLITPGGPGGALRYLIPREADRFYGVNVRMNFN
ncbi:MAG: TonB-dependent receptor [Rhodospirillaceae bacterium]|nr:TonB-dependent receptor [Rhodospirillaceae bacterium]